ncbi:DUF167 family protein [Kaistia geumhonensis]|uniref:UPF0235 protein QO015_003266 n=1 Tax=Kaistia geumhonensis TaxID=410839 RepID=A0ABU0M9P5_9HYPH|nr:DUF167 family protein [Kaistia geumhonensis]MCX5480644.1 DUF167 family protein [Kaistia geumhonensis]MDQ0517653.1 uncharacterized protein (TIGR00251 family) [Kaistia geumhonensis]
MSGPARLVSGGILIDVRLTPRGGRDAIDGLSVLSDGRSVMSARVRAVPEKGAANAALTALVAETFGVARGAVVVVSGQTSRVKTVRIEGDAEALMARAVALGGEAGRRG